MNKFNHWFDTLEEPKRLITLLLFILPIIGLASGSFGIISELIGFAMIVFLITTRMWYVYKRDKI